MWAVILIIFFVGLSLSAVTFYLQYRGWCPTGPALPGYWAQPPPARGQVQQRKEEQGLPKDIAQRLRSYGNLIDVTHQMPAIHESLTEEGECLICQEEMQSQKMAQLPCGHVYHKDCVVSWLQHKPTCPTCRTVITEENINGFPVKRPEEAPDIEMGMVKSPAQQ